METISKGIEVLALELHNQIDKLKELDKKVKEVKARINNIKTKELAELVDTEGYQVGSKIALSNGKTIVVKEFFVSSIPALPAIAREKDPEKQLVLQDRRVKAFKWLDDSGKGDVIKNIVTVKFNREEGNKAKALMGWMLERGIVANRDENVHPGTLNSTLKEAMSNGESVPMQVFNIYRGIVVDAK